MDRRGFIGALAVAVLPSVVKESTTPKPRGHEGEPVLSKQAVTVASSDPSIIPVTHAERFCIGDVVWIPYCQAQGVVRGLHRDAIVVQWIHAPILPLDAGCTVVCIGNAYHGEISQYALSIARAERELTFSAFRTTGPNCGWAGCAGFTLDGSSSLPSSPNISGPRSVIVA